MCVCVWRPPLELQNETEWQSFLRQCLEFVGKVSELFPAEAFQLILPLLENYSMIYLSLADIVHEQQGGALEREGLINGSKHICGGDVDNCECLDYACYAGCSEQPYLGTSYVY